MYLPRSARAYFLKKMLGCRGVFLQQLFNTPLSPHMPRFSHVRQCSRQPRSVVLSSREQLAARFSRACVVMERAKLTELSIEGNDCRKCFSFSRLSFPASRRLMPRESCRPDSGIVLSASECICHASLASIF